MYIWRAVRQVAKWGNSFAIRLPAAVTQALELRPGDEVEIEVAGAPQFAVRRTPSRAELAARLRRFR